MKYVILVHEADYKAYDFLYEQQDLTVALEKLGITLFQNDYPTAKVYAVDSVVSIKSLDEYLELSQTQDVMEHLYIIGSSSSKNSSADAGKLSFTEKSPVRYQVEGTSHKYTVFIVPQNVNTDYWEYSGSKPVRNLGFMPAFESSSDGGEIVYARFYHIYLPSYIICLITLVFVAWHSFKKEP